MNICIYGAASDAIDKTYLAAGEELGRKMAKRGDSLVFGGGNSGMMGAVARGMYEFGGHIIGIAPRFFKPDGVLFEHCSEFFYTDDMRSRKELLQNKADGYIVCPGGIGTYDEFMEIFTLITLKQLKKPIAIYNINGYFDPLIYLLRHTADNGFMKKENFDCLFVSDNADSIIKYLEENR